MASKTFTATSFTCDRCGHGEIADLQSPAATPWAFATSSEYGSGVPIIAPPEGAHQVDLCPACAVDLKGWWARKPVRTMGSVEAPAKGKGKAGDAL